MKLEIHRLSYHNRVILFGFTAKSQWEKSGDHSPDMIRESLQSMPGFKESQLAYLRQIHSGTLYYVREGGLAGEGDGLLSDQPFLTLTIQTADCLPVLFWDTMHPWIAIAHAGWKGLKNHILQNTLDTLREKIGSLRHLQIWIGPGLKSCHFEVTEEFLPNFPDSSFHHEHGRFFFDPIIFIKSVFAAYGIKDSQIFIDPACTYCNPEFFSYRRDQRTPNRHVFFIQQLSV